MEIITLFINLIIILLAAELFVNAIEWIGKMFNLSEGAVGSILAAIGTALPETLIPVLALLSGDNSKADEIGIGAILGAPLMLSTLTMFVTGIAVIIFKNRRKHKDKVMVNYKVISHDLKFFIFSFSIALICGFIPSEFKSIKICFAILLFVNYLIYIIKVVKENKSHETDLPNLYFGFGKEKNLNKNVIIFIIFLQTIIALTLIIFGANHFIDSLSIVAGIFNVPAFVLAIIITPIATELPEKFNSVLWISREKDTLALSNITGAMMFQASILPGLAILLTDWSNNFGTSLSAIITLFSSCLLLLELNIKKHLTVRMLISCGMFYLIFILFVCLGIIS